LPTQKKILIVVESIDVEDSSGSKANVALIQNLHKAGFEVLVYHYTRKEIQLPGITCMAIKEKRWSGLFFLSRMERYIRTFLKLSLSKPLEKVFGFSFTLFNDRNSIVTALRKIEGFNPDLVFTLSKGNSFRPHHALLKMPEWHYKWIAYIHDPYPMHAFPRPYDWVEPGHQQKRNFFLQVAEKSKYAAYPSKLLAVWMESYFPMLKGKAVIIPHQLQDEEYKEVKTLGVFNKKGFTIVHAGALMSARNPLALINAYCQFLKDFPDAKTNSQLLFLGSKSIYTPTFLEVRKETPQVYSSDANLPFEIVLAIMRQASVNVILEAKGPSSPFLPGKFPHCIQANRPILLLGPFYSESKRLLGNDYPWWSEIDDQKRILLLIKQNYLNWLENKAIRLNRPDLRGYLSEKFLKESIDKILTDSPINREY